jgi:putative glycosyltransferase (TIGR04372 family)
MYTPAIGHVIDRGGWVVRVGDRQMRPLSGRDRVVDYAHSPLTTPWMDVFLLGACRFFIGNSYSPAYVPSLFGVPCVLTNWFPTGYRPFNSRDLYIPTLYRAFRPQRLLSFAESLAPPLGVAVNYVDAKALNLLLVPNTPDELREIVSEMIDRFDGTIRYTDEDELLQQTFDVVANDNCCIGNAAIGRGFLRRHVDLL